MISTKIGTVLSVQSTINGISELEVNIDGNSSRAINYDNLTGPAKPNDRVLLNTTAVVKKLGTGGNHFVMANMSRPERDAAVEGHIMKLRYSPSQVKVLAVEEQESPYFQIMSQAVSLQGTPVIVGTLHSMLAAAAAAIYGIKKGKARVAYVMTDGAALPLPLSKLVQELKQKDLIHTTITCGHAFGGDLEAVTVYSALLAARAVARADIIIVTMGPGIVGTASQFGFTGIEQGEIINAVNILGGQAVAIPRISFADQRERHFGLSHHSRTALGKVALTPCSVPIPVSLFAGNKKELVLKQLKESGISTKHQVLEVDSSPGLEVLREKEINVKTMGRSLSDDPQFFEATAAAGVLACKLLP
ncbi:MAG: DUF3866 family protein [Firmicutes bacterium]|nr:DUF3866 family protein [Bacillota bacterium]